MSFHWLIPRGGPSHGENWGEDHLALPRRQYRRDQPTVCSFHHAVTAPTPASQYWLRATRSCQMSLRGTGNNQIEGGARVGENRGHRNGANGIGDGGTPQGVQ